MTAEQRVAEAGHMCREVEILSKLDHPNIGECQVLPCHALHAFGMLISPRITDSECYLWYLWRLHPFECGELCS